MYLSSISTYRLAEVSVTLCSMGNGGEFASVGLSQLDVTETDEPALIWDVVLCGVSPFDSRSKPVVGWSVCVVSSWTA